MTEVHVQKTSVDDYLMGRDVQAITKLCDQMTNEIARGNYIIIGYFKGDASDRLNTKADVDQFRKRSLATIKAMIDNEISKY